MSCFISRVEAICQSQVSAHDHLISISSMLVWHNRPRTNPCCCGVTKPFLVRKLRIAAQTIFSMNLQMIEVRATGRKFAITALFPFLWIGTMCASFHLLGTSASSIDLRKIWPFPLHIPSAAYFSPHLDPPRCLVGVQFGKDLFYLFKKKSKASEKLLKHLSHQMADW